jgi:hypothetical protein
MSWETVALQIGANESALIDLVATIRLKKELRVSK